MFLIDCSARIMENSDGFDLRMNNLYISRFFQCQRGNDKSVTITSSFIKIYLNYERANINNSPFPINYRN